jgi:DNA polymerase-3 subunit alpha
MLAAEGDPFSLIRRGDWVALVDGGTPLARDLAASLSPRSETDLMLLLAAGTERGPRRDLVERIAAVRSGSRPAPVALPRLAAVLRETDGVPFFQEQMVEIIENLTGCPRRNAESIYRDLREGGGAELARERSLFVRRAADRGVVPDVAAQIFSILLTLAPHAACRGDLLPHARRILLAADRKSLDPVSFAASALNGCLEQRRRLQGLLAGFRREGVEFLPIDRNGSGFEYRLEGGAVRVGLAVIPGLTRELGELYVRERESGGFFEGDADLIGRLAALRFPRAVLDEIAKVLCAGSLAGPPSAAPAEAVPLARETTAPRPYPTVGEPRTGRRPRSSRPSRRKTTSQTAFSFIRRRESSTGEKKGARKSFGKREER